MGKDDDILSGDELASGGDDGDETGDENEPDVSFASDDQDPL